MTTRRNPFNWRDSEARESRFHSYYHQGWSVLTIFTGPWSVTDRGTLLSHLQPVIVDPTVLYGVGPRTYRVKSFPLRWGSTEGRTLPSVSQPRTLDVFLTRRHRSSRSAGEGCSESYLRTGGVDFKTRPLWWMRSVGPPPRTLSTKEYYTCWLWHKRKRRWISTK